MLLWPCHWSIITGITRVCGRAQGETACLRCEPDYVCHRFASFRHGFYAAYFSAAPYLRRGSYPQSKGESIMLQLLAAGTLMRLGAWLHVTELHEHVHVHEELAYDHNHVHDEHRQHAHQEHIDPSTRHRYSYQHRRLVHTHPISRMKCTVITLARECQRICSEVDHLLLIWAHARQLVRQI